MLTMAHDVMISHSHADKTAADAACAALEARGIRCWIAPRDINPGQDWAASIVEAIRDAQIMLLVFSRHANQSPQVQREVERAANSGKVLLPLRLEDVLPEAALAYYLGTPHWLDAITPPFEAHLEKLADACASSLAITSRLERDTDQGSAAGNPPPETATPRPPLPGPTGDQRSRRRRRIALAGGAAVIATIIVVLAMVFTNGGEHANRPPARPANTGPFTGVYRADFGPSATHGKPDQGATPSTGQWAVRSACRSTGCVATATASGGATLASAFVFDDIGGQWHAVSDASVASLPPDVSGLEGCIPGEYWTVITLQMRPDGTLGGQYRATGPPECETERTVTFTRIGDVDLTSRPDPASQAVRVASPAEAWHGRYHGTITPDTNTTRKPHSFDVSVETDCLRTGERCISESADSIYIFADGKWTHNYDGKSACDLGGYFETKVYLELPLPQPPQDPITLLTGHGHLDTPGGNCVGSYDEDVKYERTGD
jgi:hypothetical protein